MPTVNITVSSGTQDGTSGTGSGYNNNASSIRVGGYYGTANWWTLHVDTEIPEGAEIISATITGNVITKAGSGAKIIWYGVKQTAPTYPTNSTDYDGRTLTTASVTQDHNATGAFTSSSLVSIVQELVDQSGFGGDILIFAKDNGSNAAYGGFENWILLTAHDAGSGTFATLNVTYEEPAEGGTSGNLLLLGVG